MANRAVAESRAPQIMECRGNAAEIAARIRLGPRGHVGMAFKTRKPDFMTVQHPWIRGAVRLVAGPASISASGRMLKREWPALIGVAFEAARLVRRYGLYRSREHASVGIVAINARHRRLRQPVF